MRLIMDKIYTVKEVAAILQISTSKVYDMATKNKIPNMRIGRNVRFRESELANWIDQLAEADSSQEEQWQ